MLGASGVRMAFCCLFAGGVATFIPMCWLITSQAAAQKNCSDFSKCHSLALVYQCSPAEGTVTQCENHRRKSFKISTTRAHIAVLICLAETVLCCIRGPTHFNKLRVGH